MNPKGLIGMGYKGLADALGNVNCKGSSLTSAGRRPPDGHDAVAEASPEEAPIANSFRVHHRCPQPDTNDDQAILPRRKVGCNAAGPPVIASQS